MNGIAKYNRGAWDAQVRQGNEWTVPVTAEVIAAARRGAWSVVLTPVKPVPKEWFPPLAGLRVLGLASAGGQQGPVLAARGAEVTILDNSPAQLEQDRTVAEREGLKITTVLGDMRDLGMFAEGSFDLIFHPCSNTFVPEVRTVWREAHRVLRRGGMLLAGFINPAAFIFDDGQAEQGVLQVRHRLPYSDVESLTDTERQQLMERNEPFIFSHSLEDQIGGQCEAGFSICGLYEDSWKKHELSKFMPSFIATRAVKPEK